MTPTPETGFDEQDQSEAFDEDNFSIDEEGVPDTERRTFEELPEVRDSTRAAGDNDEDAALIAEELDDEAIIALSEEAGSVEIEDDQDGLLDTAPDQDRGERVNRSPAAADEVALQSAGDATRFAEGQARPGALEADRLSEGDIAALGYGGGARDDVSADPVRFDIMSRGGLWIVLRDGEEVRTYSHADRAIKEAGELARGLRATGQPAEVFFASGEGRTIQVTDDPVRQESPQESSAVVPDRSTDG